MLQHLCLGLLRLDHQDGNSVEHQTGKARPVAAVGPYIHNAARLETSLGQAPIAYLRKEIEREVSNVVFGLPRKKIKQSIDHLFPQIALPANHASSCVDDGYVHQRRRSDTSSRSLRSIPSAR